MLVLLRGGPDDVPRVWEAPAGGGEEVKIPRGNGHEHFVFTDEYADIGVGPMPVYRWSYRTAIAE